MAVIVKRERPDQRRHNRVKVPFHVTLNGRKMRVHDWSLGGFRVEGFPDAVPALGEELPFTCCVPFLGFDVAFEASAEIVRHNSETGMFACRFTELGERETELMKHYLNELINGSVSDVADTIQCIDIPITQTPLKPNTKPAVGSPAVHLGPVRSARARGLYGALGVVIVGGTGMLAHANSYQRGILPTAIAASFEMTTSQTNGRAATNDAKTEDRIKTGSFVSPVSAGQRERFRELRPVAGTTLDQTIFALESAETRLAAAEQQHDRIANMHRKGFAPYGHLQKAEKLAAELREIRERKRIELTSHLEMTDRREGQNVIGELGQHERQLSNHETRDARAALHDGTALESRRITWDELRNRELVTAAKQSLVPIFLGQAETERQHCPMTVHGKC